MKILNEKTWTIRHWLKDKSGCYIFHPDVIKELLQAQAELTRDEITTNLAIKNWDKANNPYADLGKTRTYSEKLYDKSLVNALRPSSGTIEYPYLPDYPVMGIDFYNHRKYWDKHPGIECCIVIG